MYFSEGFSFKLSYNMQFWGWRKGVVLSTILNTTITIYIIFMIKWYYAHIEDPEAYDAINWWE